MPGVPNSARCFDCKRRKIKCDLRWPTCTACERGRLTCSGPMLTTKFIYAGSHGQSTDHNASGLVTAATAKQEARPGNSNGVPSSSSVSLTQKQRRGTLNSFRIAPSPTRQYPTSVADRTAIRLVKTIEKDSRGEILLNASYLELLPVRLVESPALRDCVAFFCYMWTNFERVEHMQQSSAFIESYGKALRSLMRAIHNPNTRLSAETCAAVTIMGRCNVLFDSEKLATHADALTKLMREKGPPQKGDELYRHLADCNNTIMLTHWAAHGGENHQWMDPWKEALGWECPPKDLSNAQPDMKGRPARSYFHLLGQWPELITRLKKIRSLKAIDDEKERLARRTHELAKGLFAQIDSIHQLNVEDYQSGMLMKSTLGDDYPSEVQLNELPSNNFKLLRPLAASTVLQIVYSRIAFDLSCILEEPDQVMYDKYLWACKQAWCLLPHFRMLGPISVLACSFPLYLCFEIIEEAADRHYLIDALKSTNVRRVLPTGRKETEKWIMNFCLVLTGRDLIGEDKRIDGHQRSNLEPNISAQYNTGNTSFRAI